MTSSSGRRSFTASYLVNSLGFSSESASKVSRAVNFETSENADKVINFFKNRGFSSTQISRLVRNYPTVLLLDSEKTILPKLEFLESKGISGPEMDRTLSMFPGILNTSLAQTIKPSFDFFGNLFRSDAMAVAAVKRFPRILRMNIEKHVSPNINILREHGVPDSNIATLMHHWPVAVVLEPDRFREVVKKVEDMGFESSKLSFVGAVLAFRSMSESKWESKVDAYKKWGWSEEDFLEAFRRNPWCMRLSEDKIAAAMDLFINKMGSSPRVIAKCPVLLSLSLEKRLIPRFSVYQVLLSKGLVDKEISLIRLFKHPEKKFLQTFVAPYKEEAAELLKVYKGKTGVSNGTKAEKV